MYVQDTGSPSPRLNLKNSQWLHSLNRYICHSAKESDIIWGTLEQFIPELNLEDLVLYKYNTKWRHLHQIAAFGAKHYSKRKIINPLTIPLGHGVVGSVAQHRQVEVVADTEKDARYIIDDDRRYSECAIPVLHRGRLVGILDSENSHKHFYDEELVRTLELVAGLLASSISEIKLQDEHNPHILNLLAFIIDKKAFLNSELKLEDAASALKLSAPYLSELIKRHTQYSFRDILNQQRVHYFKQLVKDNRHAQHSILGLAFESGFNSKATFNREFKRYNNLTPSQYIKLNSKES